MSEPWFMFQRYTRRWHIVSGALRLDGLFYTYQATWNEAEDALWDFGWRVDRDSRYTIDFEHQYVTTRHSIARVEKSIPRFRERVMTALIYAKMEGKFERFGILA